MFKKRDQFYKQKEKLLDEKINNVSNDARVFYGRFTAAATLLGAMAAFIGFCIQGKGSYSDIARTLATLITAYGVIRADSYIGYKLHNLATTGRAASDMRIALYKGLPTPALENLDKEVAAKASEMPAYDAKNDKDHLFIRKSMWMFAAMLSVAQMIDAPEKKNEAAPLEQQYDHNAIVPRQPEERKQYFPRPNVA